MNIRRHFKFARPASCGIEIWCGAEHIGRLRFLEDLTPPLAGAFTNILDWRLLERILYIPPMSNTVFQTPATSKLSAAVLPKLALSGKEIRALRTKSRPVQKLLLLLTAFSWLLFAGSPRMVAAGVNEYDLKAVILLNFTLFVQWPADAFSSRQAPLTIVVLGDDPFGKSLDDAVRNESAGGHPIVIKRFDHVQDATNCQILFISKSQDSEIDRILKTLKGRSILTVSEADDFTSHGGAIALIKDKNKLRLKINLEATKLANLTLSSKLLHAATVVNN